MSCSAFGACDDEECTEEAQHNRLDWFLQLEHPDGTRNFSTRGEKIQAVNKKTSCETARAGEKKIHNMYPNKLENFLNMVKTTIGRLVKEADLAWT